MHSDPKGSESPRRVGGSGGNIRRRVSLLLVSVLLLAGCEAEAPVQTGDAPATPATGMAERITRPVESGQLHLVRMVQRADLYAFDPEQLTIRQGDVVRFITTGSQPESVSFGVGEGEVAAFVSEQRLERGPLMTQPGNTYDVHFEDAPAGTYSFRSVPHGESGMTGSVTVEVPTD